jgi:hypothetical protein
MIVARPTFCCVADVALNTICRFHNKTLERNLTPGERPCDAASGQRYVRLLPADASRADEIAPFDRGGAHGHAGAWCFNHAAVADVDAKMMNRLTIEDEVAGLQILQRNTIGEVELVGRVVRQRYTNVSPSHHGEARTIEATDAFAAPQVGLADLRQRPGNDRLGLRMYSARILRGFNERIDLWNCCWGCSGWGRNRRYRINGVTRIGSASHGRSDGRRRRCGAIEHRFDHDGWCGRYCGSACFCGLDCDGSRWLGG